MILSPAVTSEVCWSVCVVAAQTWQLAPLETRTPLILWPAVLAGRDRSMICLLRQPPYLCP